MTKRSPSIVVLTGAGVSAESGLDTFRGAAAGGGGGVWSRRRLEDVATPEGFARDPDLVHRFYNARRAALHDAAPNAAHAALARLEAEHPGGVGVVTQNVDDLHERAGSRGVIHMHGALRRAWCTACGDRAVWTADLTRRTVCAACGATGRMRPDVVWFGEIPHHLDAIYAMLERCAVFAAIGTSGQVHPAAQFVEHAAAHGAETIELSLEPSAVAGAFRHRRYGRATETVPAWVDDLLAASATG